MNRAAIALGLAGFAAAGGVWILVHAPGAPARAVAVTGVSCNAGNHPGQAVRQYDYLLINGKPPKNGKTSFLKPGDKVATTTSGRGVVCVKVGSTNCNLLPNSVLKVLPAAGVLAKLSIGSVQCKSAKLTRRFETPNDTIRFGALGLPESRALTEHSGAADDASGYVFEIVARGGATTVKVRRGATVVSRQARLEKGVVLGRNQQVVAPRNADPAQPDRIKLTTTEQKQLDRLDALLPPLRDTTPPTTGIPSTPRNPSSVRVASFQLAADESGAIFSCSLDGEPFHVCSQVQRFAGLAPGSHTLAVYATDAAGNVGPKQIFGWSVDSSRIVFASDRADNNLELYVMDPDGKNVQRLTNNKATDQDPSWSPDQKQVVFHSDRTGTNQIYVMNADSSNNNPTQLTNTKGFNLNPSWSPDGQNIAFESSRDGNSEIYVMRPDGTNVRRLTFSDAAADFDPTWSPDSRQIAFASRTSSGYDLNVINADGTGLVRLRTTTAAEFNPSWSPDGKLIAFHSDEQDGTRQIYVMSPEPGAQPRRITHSGQTDSNPVWAPDGGEIAFQRTNADGKDQLFVVSIDDGYTFQLTNSSANDLVPDW